MSSEPSRPRPQPEDLALFEADGPDALVPRDMARSLWDTDQMHGVALSGALARAAETAVADLGRSDLRPARFTVDLFRKARMRRCALETTVVREGSRVALVDVVLSQDDEPVARAGALFVKATESAPGRVWSADARLEPPSRELAPGDGLPHAPVFASGAGWSKSFADQQNAERKDSWNAGLQVVLGEQQSGFVTAASCADGASMLTNWGDHGIEYINADLTLALARTPLADGIGLSTVDRVEHDGISVGTATMFDRQGQVGTVVVTALANTRRTVDFSGVEYDDDGTRRATRPQLGGT